MKEKTFDSIIDLGCHMYDVAEGGKTITAVVFEEGAEELWQWLSDYEETKTGVIFIHGDYKKEPELFIRRYEYIYPAIATFAILEAERIENIGRVSISAKHLTKTRR